MKKKQTITTIIFTIVFALLSFSNLLAQQTEWNFNKDADKERWVVNRSGWEVSNGDLILNNYAGFKGDPTLTQVFPQSGTAIKGSDYKYAIISLKNNTLSKKWRFFFYYTNATETNKIAMLPRYNNLVPNDNQFREYVVDLSKNSIWLDNANNISRIRFDLPDEDTIDDIGTNSTIEIDYIKLVKELPNK